MINKVVLVGRLTRDIELRKTQSGTSVVSFTIACNRRSRQEGQPDADFISCVAWNRTAENMANYLHKGSLIGVEGRIQTRNYDDRDGKRVYITEVWAEAVQFLDTRNSASSRQQDGYGSYRQNDSYQQPTPPQFMDHDYNPGGNSYGSYGQEPPVHEYDGFSEPPLDIAADDLPF